MLTLTVQSQLLQRCIEVIHWNVPQVVLIVKDTKQINRNSSLCVNSSDTYLIELVKLACNLILLSVDNGLKEGVH